MSPELIERFILNGLDHEEPIECKAFVRADGLIMPIGINIDDLKGKCVTLRIVLEDE